MRMPAQGHGWWTHIFPTHHALSFSFRAVDEGYKDRSSVYIQATLHNTSADTVWYMTTTCDGLEFHFESTGRNWGIHPGGYCTVYRAIKCWIPPGGDTTFLGFVHNFKGKKEITLGFNLIEVEARTPVNLYSSGSLVEERAKMKKVLWAGPVCIEPRPREE